jgi:hypothetical protein
MTMNDLTGFFGHTYINEQQLQYQFQVVRRMGHGRYVVQLFSWLDGGKTELAVMPEKELLGPSVKLYADEKTRHWASEKQHARQRELHQMTKCRPAPAALLH